jgi:hypothetical protein
MTFKCPKCGSTTFKIERKYGIPHRAECSECGSGWSINQDVLDKSWDNKNILDIESDDIVWEKRKKKSTKPKSKRKCRCK